MGFAGTVVLFDVGDATCFDSRCAKSALFGSGSTLPLEKFRLAEAVCLSVCLSTARPPDHQPINLISYSGLHA